MRRLVLAAVLLAAGCGGGQQAADGGVPPAQVQAVATQTRADQVADRRFEITVTNVGPQDFVVRSVRLDAPGFAPAPATPRDDPFPPGIRYDLPAAYGPARCDRDVGAATAVVQVGRPGGPVGTVRVPLGSGDGLLQRLHELDCARQQLGREVRVALADLRQDGPVARGVVRVQRLASRAPLTVVELRDSKLFAFGPVALPAELPAGRPVLDLPVEVRPAGCAGHLLGDVKQPYLFPLFLRFDGGPPQYTEVASTAPEQAVLQAVLRTACSGQG